MARCISSSRYYECENRFTWIKDAPVKIEYGEEGTMEGMPSLTVMEMFQRTVDRHGDKLALAYKMGELWSKVTYNQYHEYTKATAKSLIKLGLEPCKSVAIIGFNSKEYSLISLGTIFAGGIFVGICSTSTEEGIAHVLNKAEAVVCVVDSETQLFKIMQIWDQVPCLKAVVKYFEPLDTNHKDVYMWTDFMKLGYSVPDKVLDERIANQYVNRCCLLIFTSGTTGEPKGVMLSHDNITYSVRCTGNFIKMREGEEEKSMSYLPLFHIAAQVMDIYMPLYYGYPVYFAEPDALQGSLLDAMREVQPSIFVGIPKVLDKMERKIRTKLETQTGVKKVLMNWARKKALQKADNRLNRRKSSPFAYGIARQILNPIRKKLGLMNARHLYCGAAPLTPETHEFFASIGIPFCEVYGMTEMTGAMAMTVHIEGARHWKPNSAGFTAPGLGIEVIDVDEEGYGELVGCGRHAFMGYLDDEEKTRDSIDSHYRVRTGDRGYQDEDGFIFIVGRIKEMITLADGCSVVPNLFETKLKELLPPTSNCMLVGMRRPFLIMLIALKVEVDAETVLPTDVFTTETITWCKSIGSAATKVSHVSNHTDTAVMQALDKVIKAMNDQSYGPKIKRFALLPQDFSIKGGEFGPTSKLKRHVVKEKYSALIESLYEEAM